MLAVLVLLAACGGGDPQTVDSGVAAVDATPGAADAHVYTGICKDEDRDDIYQPGMERMGDAGYRVVLVTSTPAPPAQGNNSWSVRVLDPAGGALDGLDIAVAPFMPDHGHGTPVMAEVTATGDGGYDVAPVNLFMTGFWSIKLTLSDDGTELDEILYRFCVEAP